MAYVQDHGGSCCGVRHIYGMDNTTVRQLEDLIAQVDRLDRVGRATRESGRLIEVILSQRQVGIDGAVGHRWAACVEAEGGWPVVMQRLGFRLVSRFNNANSGYDCFVFHRVPVFKSLTDLPFAWRHEVAPPVTAAGGPGALAAPREVVRERVVAPPVTVVATFYANVLQAGMGAFWPTLEAARAAAPRCRQQARIEVLSDGNRRTVNL